LARGDLHFLDSEGKENSVYRAIVTEAILRLYSLSERVHRSGAAVAGDEEGLPIYEGPSRIRRRA